MASSFLDPIFGWLLYLHPALAIFLISLLISVITTLALKFLTNQSLMKDLKKEMKELQEEMKELKNNPKKMSAVNSKFMETNMKYMTHSMKPSLFTLLPILLIFGWLTSHMAYYPLEPNQDFELTAFFKEGETGTVEIISPDIMVKDDTTKDIINNKVNWILNWKEGEYNVSVLHKDKTYTKEVIISSEKDYAPVEKEYSSGGLFSKSKDPYMKKITLSNKKIIPFKDVPILQNIPWVSGWGWFGVYIFFSLAFSMILRKILNIY